MIAAVADTHTVVWYLFGDPRLSLRARTTIDEAASAGKQVAVSSITLAELIYLVEKNRLEQIVLDRLFEVLQGEEIFAEAPFDQAVAQAMRTVSRSQIPDLPDRNHCRDRCPLGSASDQPRRQNPSFLCRHDLVIWGTRLLGAVEPRFEVAGLRSHHFIM